MTLMTIVSPGSFTLHVRELAAEAEVRDPGTVASGGTIDRGSSGFMVMGFAGIGEWPKPSLALLVVSRPSLRLIAPLIVSTAPDFRGKLSTVVLSKRRSSPFVVVFPTET